MHAFIAAIKLVGAWFLSNVAFAALSAMPNWIASLVYGDKKLSADIAFPAFGGPEIQIDIRDYGSGRKLAWKLDIRNHSRIYHCAPVVVIKVVWKIDGVVDQRSFKPEAAGRIAPLEVFTLLNDAENKALSSWGPSQVSFTATVYMSVHGRSMDRDLTLTGKINA